MSWPLSGLPARLAQRLSAVLMLGFVVFVLAHFLIDPPHSREAWRSWVGNPGVSVAAMVFVAALLTQAWVGLRDVTLDCAASLAARIATDSRDRATPERLDDLNDVYRLFCCRSIMNGTEVCPKGLAPSRAVESIRLAMAKGAL